jgi:hypothetical protein
MNESEGHYQESCDDDYPEGWANMQRALFDNACGRARKNDPETSKTAARSIKPRLLESLVIAALQDYGPMTTSVIAEIVRVPRDSISPRMKPMEQRGLVVRTSEKRDGRIVWRLA